jgi:branched-chain amino acid transport system ATP-binding protein
MALLEVKNVTRRFGGIVALDDVSFDVEAGQIAGLIGPNGAGKTTLFNVITRVYRPDGGEVIFDGSNLLRTAPHKIVRRGIARTFQNVELFPGMSVLENVLVGTHAGTRWFGERRARRRAQEALDEVGAGDLAGRRATGLPFGTLKRVELARALVAEPRLLLLDEPTAGVNPVLVRSILGHLNTLRDEGVTILFVEHDMDVVRGISDWVVCMAEGQVIAEGSAASVAADEAVVDAYLGTRRAGGAR